MEQMNNHTPNQPEASLVHPQPVEAEALEKSATKAAPLLYDATAEQKIYFTKTKKGLRYPITVTFKPLGDELGDLALLDYDRARDVRMSAAGDDMDAKSQLFSASVGLFKALVVEVEGWGPEDGSKLKDKDRYDAIQNGLLACQIDDLPIADAQTAAETRPWEDDDDDTEVYPLRALFNGEEVTMMHEMKEPTDGVGGQQERYSQLMTRARLGKGEKIGKADTKVPSRMKPLCKLYDEMMVSVTGYKGNIVPRHHKLEVIHKHMGGEMETQESK